QTIPAVDAVEYFARALREPANDEGNALSSEVVDELRQAVFEEGAPVAALRRRFDPVLRPTSEDERRVEAAKKTSSAAKRLGDQIAELDGIDAEVAANVESALEALRRELDAIVASFEVPKQKAS
ncbi:MAG: hypothetical protein H5U40_18745, partial [Polyangiaceae bacterium]|nr:hypothetical protein [Polyangiaceae bacterium]